VISGGETVEQVKKLKEESVELFNQGGCPIHKWHSSDPQFEEQQLVDENQTEELGANCETSRNIESWDEVAQT
jgi:hypothetical protein